MRIYASPYHEHVPFEIDTGAYNQTQPHIAKAAARTALEYRVSSLRPKTDPSKKILFEFDLYIESAKGDCTINAHIDLDRGRKIGIGDYITMQSFPIQVNSPSTCNPIRVCRIE